MNIVNKKHRAKPALYMNNLAVSWRHVFLHVQPRILLTCFNNYFRYCASTR